MKDIEKRWKERVVPNGWDALGRIGASFYLHKYGKNISNDKLKAFADYARGLGLDEFADGMLETVNPWKVVTLEYADKNDFNGDIIDLYNDATDDGVYYRDVQIVITTAQELARRGYGTACGGKNNKPYAKIAEKYPDLKIRCCVYEYLDEGVWRKETGSPDIYITGERMGEEISELAGEGGGSLRCDWCEKNWTYFETE
jgi:hypothetical protein